MYDKEFIQLLGEKENAPLDLKEGFLLQEAHPVFISDKSEKLKQLLNDKKICYNSNKRKSKKPQWTQEGKSSLLGNISPDGSFTINATAKPIFYNWVVQRQDESGKSYLEGPYVNKEMKMLLYQNKLANTKIKRECDSVFVSFEEIYEKYENFIYVKNAVLDEIFKEHELELEDQREEQFYDEVVFLEEKKFPRSSSYLKRKNVGYSTIYLLKMIKAKTKRKAVEILKDQTKMSDDCVRVFLDFLLEEAKQQVLIDVDKDGFVVQNNIKNKGSQKKHR